MLKKREIPVRYKRRRYIGSNSVLTPANTFCNQRTKKINVRTKACYQKECNNYAYLTRYAHILVIFLRNILAYRLQKLEGGLVGNSI